MGENDPLPTVEEIDRLTAFLPKLYAEGFSPVQEWEGGERLEDGSLTFPYPRYHPLVEEFFAAVRGSWIDFAYDPEQAYEMLKDEQAVRSASLPQIKSMLTYCVRGERFSDGHWATMIEKGYIRWLLERLIEIRSGLDRQ
jgi:hypothetical protein